MNILVLALNFSPELVGCAKFTTEFVDWLSKKENKIIVITTNPYYPEWKCKSNNYKRTVKKYFNYKMSILYLKKLMVLLESCTI